jgi:ABC-type branched-subunit amino acid transport system ATPase component/ABC-type branched-subunit amino acid transport system permease subunit
MRGRAAFAAAACLVTVLLILRADGYQVYIIALVGLTAVVAVGLNILVGLAGQVSLGHVAFYAIGAYTVGVLTTKLNWSFWPACAAALALSGLAGAALSLPALRVRGPYLAMVTIAFGFLVEQGAAEWSGLTGGWNGLFGIAPPRLIGHEFRERDIALLVLVQTILVLSFYAGLSRSPWGQAMRALRESETAGRAIGLNPVQVRTAAFTFSAMLAGLAGGTFAALSTFISPESFPFSQSILFLLVVVVGGAETLLGPLIGAIIVVLLPELLSTLAQYRLLFVGVLFLLVLRAAPEGIVGLARPYLGRKRDERFPQDASHIEAWLSPTSTGSTLVAKSLGISFGGVKAVRDVSFKAPPSRITSIIGPNGAGKSTVLNLVCGFYRPGGGSIRFGDHEITGFRSETLARLGIARTFQTTQLFGGMTVLENVMIALRRGALGTRFVEFRRDAEAEKTAGALLHFVGYRGPLEQTAAALPHVEKRLVEIARALALKPQLLALDEPAAGLGAADKHALAHLLRRIADFGIAVVLVEHDMSLVMGVSDQIVVLDAGQRIALGSPDAVAADPAVRAAYLGTAAASAALTPATRVLKDDLVVRASSLGSGYGPIRVLAGVDVEIAQGELVAILGSNGAGKSTLVRALAGLNRPITGSVVFEGRHLEQLPVHLIAAQGLILVPEGRQLFPELSVLDNLQLGAFARPTPHLATLTGQLLDRFPRLRDLKNQRAGLLSGGEQQMLAIARGLIARPKVLILDEPSLGLAPMLVDTLYELFSDLRDEQVTLLLVDQMAARALSIAHRGYLLRSGRVEHGGPAAMLAADDTLVGAYLGSATHENRKPLE